MRNLRRDRKWWAGPAALLAAVALSAGAGLAWAAGVTGTGKVSPCATLAFAAETAPAAPGPGGGVVSQADVFVPCTTGAVVATFSTEVAPAGGSAVAFVRATCLTGGCVGVPPKVASPGKVVLADAGAPLGSGPEVASYALVGGFPVLPAGTWRFEVVASTEGSAKLGARNLAVLTSQG
jgi:hypothetical protein